MKKILILVFIFMFSVSSGECKKLEYFVEPEKIRANPGEKINFKVIFKNFKKIENIAINPPDVIWVLEKKETIDQKDRKEINYSLNIPSDVSPNVYKIESKAKINGKENKKYLTISIPYKCSKAQNPPVISEASCSPCYWGYKRSARFENVIFYSLYDEKNLYIAVQVKDEDVSSDDNIDLYLFVKNKMHIFSFSPKGEYKGETKVNWVKKIFGTIDNSKDTDNSYWIVFSIPLNLLKITPQEKEIIKINVVNIDNKSGFKSWSNLINSENFLKNPELFVDFIFED
jgi:hypothetical protein